VAVLNRRIKQLSPASLISIAIIHAARFGDGHPVAQRISSEEEMSYTGMTLNMIYAAKTDWLEDAPCEGNSVTKSYLYS
jgi:hypothetical protein